MRLDYGLWSRCLINRDATFLALLGSSLTEQRPAATHTTCCNPWGQTHDLYQTGPLLHYTSAVTICALGTKLEDDAEDERGWRRTAATTGGWLLEECVSKAAGILHGLAFPVAKVRAAMGSQRDVEQAEADVVTAAAPTALAYAEMYSHAGCMVEATSETQMTLRTLGHQLGFLIYAKDAWDDFDDDAKQRRFNPLVRYGKNVDDRREGLVPQMRQALVELTQAFEQLPLLRNRDLLYSMAVTGSGLRIDQIVSKPGDDDDKRGGKEKKEKQSCCDRCDSNSCNCGDCCDVCQFARCGRSSGSKSSCQSCGRSGSGNECCDCNPCDGDGFDCCGCDCG